MTPQEREIMQMALDVLELVDGYVMGMHEAKEALYEALAQPEQEPVAWISNAEEVKGQFVEGRPRRVWWECNTGVGQPLYTAPQQREWQGLTDEELRKTVDGYFEFDGGDMWGSYRAIEAKLKEKNK